MPIGGNEVWFFAKDGRRYGPLSLSEVKANVASGTLERTDLVWTEGMPEWIEIGSVPRIIARSGPESPEPPPFPAPTGQVLPRVSVFEGIVFCEKDLPQCLHIKNTEIAIHGFLFGQAQLKSLDDVKRKLCAEVRRLDANCLVNFTYGQRSNWLTTLFGLDDVSWYGGGEIGRLSESLYRQIVGQ